MAGRTNSNLGDPGSFWQNKRIEYLGMGFRALVQVHQLSKTPQYRIVRCGKETRIICTFIPFSLSVPSHFQFLIGLAHMQDTLQQINYAFTKIDIIHRGTIAFLRKTPWQIFSVFPSRAYRVTYCIVLNSNASEMPVLLNGDLE